MGRFLCFLNSEINFPDSIEEHNPILFETLIRNQVLNSMILHEKVDSSFRNGQGNSSHGFIEDHFRRMLEDLQLEQFFHGKQIT